MLRFFWKVDGDGYDWLEAYEPSVYDPDGPSGHALYIQGLGGPLKEYSLFPSKAAIHRDLALLNEDESETDGVLEFCAEYGLLDHNLPSSVSPSVKTKSGGIALRQGPDGRFMQAQELLSLEAFWFYQRDVRAAIEAIDDNNNEEAVRLFNTQSLSVTPRIQFNPTKLRHPYELIPRDLRSAIWLLIEQEIGGETRWRRCKFCQTWFIPKTARAEYCQDKCRKALDRRKRKERSNGINQ